jgi:GNAT superfamily N-acetyltransferase
MSNNEQKMNIRHDHEIAECIEQWGWKYHHLGIPTKEKMPDERYIPHFKFYVSGFPTSPFGVEWMRFDADSPVHPLVQTVPHLAFVVQDLNCELTNRNFNVITEPNPPSEGVRVAMIEHNGAPIELIEFEKLEEMSDFFNNRAQIYEEKHLEHVITDITSNTLKSSNVLQLVWSVFEEFVAYQFSAEGVREFQNYFEYSSMKRLMDNLEMLMWGCFHNDRIVGMIATKPPSHISLLFVDKQYHRQGIARALYQRVIEYYSKDDDCTEITVYSSLYAVEAYKRLGFVATDTEQLKNGIRFVPMKHEFNNLTLKT